MATGRLRVIKAVPGPATIAPLISAFERKGGGILTAFSDAFLPSARALLPEVTNVEVKTFSEVVRDFHRQTGQDTPRIAPGGQQLASIVEICQALPTGSFFEEVHHYPGFQKAVQTTLKELHGWGITSDELFDLSDQTPDRSLSEKLRALAMIDSGSKEILQEIRTITLTDLIRSCESEFLDDDNQAKPLLVFIHGQAPPLWLRWLKWVSEQGVDVQVVFNWHPGQGRVFEQIPDSIKILGGEVSELGSGNRLMRSLFSDQDPVGPQLENGVHVLSAADPLSECEWALRHIDAQDPDQEVVILARNSDAYFPLLDSVAKRFGMPLAMRRRVPLRSNGFARFCLELLAAFADSDVRRFGKLMPCAYVTLTKEARLALQLAIKDAHRAPDQWAALYETLSAIEGEAFDVVKELVAWRVEHAKQSLPLSDWYNDMKAMFQSPWCLENATSAPAVIMDRDQRAFTAFCVAIRDRVTILIRKEAPLFSLFDYCRLVAELTKDADVSVPREESRISVVQSPEEVEGGDLVVVLGMLEGVFPRRRSEDPILSDEDREAISNLLLEKGKIPIRLLNSHDKAKEERSLFYRVAALAKKQLVLSYPLTDSERDNVKAFYVDEVMRIAEVSQEIVHRRNQWVPRAEAITLAADARLAEALDAHRVAPLSNDLVTAEARDVLRRDELEVSPSGFRTLANCPFAYFAKDTLKLSPRRPRDRFGSLSQVPMDASLPSAPDRETARARLQAEVEKQLDDLRMEVPAWELQLIRSASIRLVEEWIDREFEAREFWDRNTGNTIDQPEFGSDLLAGSRLGLKLKGRVPAITVDGNTQTLHLFRSSAPEKIAGDDSTRRTELLKYGLYFAAMVHTKRALQIEVDGMNGRRTLIGFGRDPYAPKRSDAARELRDLDFLSTEAWKSDSGDLKDSRDLFANELKTLVQAAIETVRKGELKAVPGSHCLHCDFGDLCRRSSEFSEVADTFTQALFEALKQSDKEGTEE